MSTPTAIDGGFTWTGTDFIFTHTAETDTPLWNQKYLLDNTNQYNVYDNLPDTFAYYETSNTRHTYNESDPEDCYEKFTFTLSDMSYRLLCIHLKFEVTEYTYYHNYEPDGPQYRETKRVGSVRIEYTRKDGSIQHINLESLVTGGSKVFDGWVNIQDEVSSLRIIGTTGWGTYLSYSGSVTHEKIIHLKMYYCCPYFIKPSHLAVHSPKWGVVKLAKVSDSSVSLSIANSVHDMDLKYYYNGIESLVLFYKVVFGQEFWIAKTYGCLYACDREGYDGVAIVYV